MIASQMIYLELFFALFFLPGFFITVILGIKKFRFLLSFALSYSLLVLTLLPFEYYARPIAMWQWCVLLEWAILAAWAIAKILSATTTSYWRGRLDCPAGSGDPARKSCCRPVPTFQSRLSERSGGISGCHKRCSVSGHNLIRYLFNPRRLVPLVLAGVICGYLAYAGIYLEIPSDAWTHVFWFKWQKLSIIDNAAFPSGLSWGNFFLHHTCPVYFNPWYFIHAWLCHVSNLPVMESIHVLTFVNILVFLLAIYYFGLFLFSGLRISAFKKMMMAAISALFAAATIGNMVFAYIRYYAFAPTILNYVLFLAAMAVVITWLRSKSWLGHALWIAPVLLIVTDTIHTQEALFIFFMTWALCLVASARILWRKFFGIARHVHKQNVIPASLLRRSKAPGCEGRKAGIQGKKLWIPISRLGVALRRSLVMGMTKWKERMAGVSVYDCRWTAREWKNMGLAALLLLVFLAGFIAVRDLKPGAWLAASMPPAGLPVEPSNFIFNKLLVSLPQNLGLRLVVCLLFIFYQTVGFWGLFVYLLFILMFRQFVKQPYLIAGMIVPFLTAFNPLMVDMMARMGQAPTLYRFHYIVPLPFIGGYLFIYLLGKAREWLHRMRLVPAADGVLIWPRLSWINCVGCLLVLAGLVGLIFPINVAGIYAPYSKVYTLRKIPAVNDYHLYDDLGKIMAQYENKVILTDGWTSSYLAFYSPKNTYAYVKWLNSSNPENEPPVPFVWKKLRNQGLIIINRRDGALSITGKITRHWREDVLPKVSRNYSIEAQHYLESHPEKFRKIWSQNRIAVYAVR